jgi:hypothetical protein
MGIKTGKPRGRPKGSKNKSNTECQQEQAPHIGAPSSYEPGFARQTQLLCELGATDAEIAEFFGVTRATITNWKAAHPAFLSALKAGKAEADDRVERSLYHKAIGYTFDAVKIFMPAGAPGPVYAPYKEHMPPDTTACIFWLKNRRQQQWRDVHKHEHGRAGEFDKMSPDELRNFIARETEALGLGDQQPKTTNGSGKPH